MNLRKLGTHFLLPPSSIRMAWAQAKAATKKTKNLFIFCNFVLAENLIVNQRYMRRLCPDSSTANEELERKEKFR